MNDAERIKRARGMATGHAAAYNEGWSGGWQSGRAEGKAMGRATARQMFRAALVAEIERTDPKPTGTREVCVRIATRLGLDPDTLPRGWP